MIKRYIQFVTETKSTPGQDTPGSTRITLDKDEMEYFVEEVPLSNLIATGKISLYNNELWYKEDDLETIDILNQYFPNALEKEPIGSDEENESKVNEGRIPADLPKRWAKIKKTLRIEPRDDKTYAFIEVIDGDAKNAKEVRLSSSQRERVEKILNELKTNEELGPHHFPQDKEDHKIPHSMLNQFKNTKILNYADAGYGQIFWDQDNNIICGIHENDGEFRSEYMTGMFEHYGITVKRHDEVPEFVKEWSDYENYGE